jgi:hypothetical protein
MTAPDAAASPYARHGALSDPRRHGAALARLPRDVGALCGIVQGLLLHDYYGLRLYGAPPRHVVEASRATLPVAARLDAILAASPGPLDWPRAPFERAVGTCRDFALLLCALLRQQGVPARVRCGFALYFLGGEWEDHWVCEYWQAADGRWALADAELDAPHRRHLGIAFDPADLPRAQFLLAWEAWERCRADPALEPGFGHGEARGAWFLQVNLARDLLALCQRETSAWDTWRSWPQPLRALDASARRRSDRLAALAKAAGGHRLPALDESAQAALQATTPWHA